ncbi:MAG: hypothetical protein ABWK05_04005 [Pyrobaculum sp.]
MTNVVNYAITIAAAILIAATASLVYVLYQHAQAPTSTAPPPVTTTSKPTPPPNTTAHTATTIPTATTPLLQTRVLSAVLYVATPDITRCAGLGNRYIYYFNITLERARIEDPVSIYVFKARAGNATYNLTSASYLPLNREFFEPYNFSISQLLGVLHIYLELYSQEPLDISSVIYLNNEYRIEKISYVACVKSVEIRGVVNKTLPGPGRLNLIPTDKVYTIKLELPPGRYRVSAPPDVVVPSEVEGGGAVAIPIGFLNKPLVYEKLNITLAKAR